MRVLCLTVALSLFAGQKREELIPDRRLRCCWEEASRTQSRSNKQTPAALVRGLESLASLPRQRCRQLPDAGDRCVAGDCCLFATARLIRHGASAQAPLCVALAFVFRKVMLAAMIPLV